MSVLQSHIGLKRNCLFQFRENRPNFFIFASRLCFFLTRIFAKTFGGKILSRAFSKKQIFLQKSVRIKKNSKNCPFVTPVADNKFFLFVIISRKSPHLLNFAFAKFVVVFVYFRKEFSRKCKTNFSREFSRKFKNVNFRLNPNFKTYLLSAGTLH
jgi:hypothetical protein